VRLRFLGWGRTRAPLSSRLRVIPVGGAGSGSNFGRPQRHRSPHAQRLVKRGVRRGRGRHWRRRCRRRSRRARPAASHGHSLATGFQLDGNTCLRRHLRDILWENPLCCASTFGLVGSVRRADGFQEGLVVPIAAPALDSARPLAGQRLLVEDQAHRAAVSARAHASDANVEVLAI